jgi:hypothetical protein
MAGIIFSGCKQLKLFSGLAIDALNQPPAYEAISEQIPFSSN